MKEPYGIHRSEGGSLFPFRGSGLVFSVTYLRGRLAPSAFHPSGWLRFPPKIRHEKDGALPPVTRKKASSLGSPPERAS
ncbi:MAG: hypothetical protein DRG82_06920 [Deltaproteobacteria bacterium]|nr:MAG: hypothetical protein DRG82_06920 [Deltaproteobacteria bacterium]